MKNVLVATVMASVGVATSAAADTLNVAYISSATAVPTLAEWAMIAMAMALGTAAVFMIRRKNLGGGLAVGLAAVIGWGALGSSGLSQAAEKGLFLDGSSPDVFSLRSTGSLLLTVSTTRETGMTLTGVTVDDTLDADAYVIVPGPDTTCVASFQLSINSSCTVRLSNLNAG